MLLLGAPFGSTMDQRAVKPGRRALLELFSGGVGGTHAEPTLGMEGAVDRNPLASPLPLGMTRSRTQTPITSPSFIARSPFGNRCVGLEDDSPDVPTEHEGKRDMSGYRLVDINLLGNFLEEHFVCKQCTQGAGAGGGAGRRAAASASGVQIVKESRSGLASCFTTRCAAGHENRFWTSPDVNGRSAGDHGCGKWGAESGPASMAPPCASPSASSSASSSAAAPPPAPPPPAPAATAATSTTAQPNTSSMMGVKETNVLAASGAMAIGIGATAFELLFAFLDVPLPRNFTTGAYRKHEDRAGSHYMKCSWQLCDENVKREIALTVAAHNNGTLGRPVTATIDGKTVIIIDASYDGGWTKRSTGKCFSSPSGQQMLYGRFTRKPVSFCTLGRNCAKCDAAMRRIAAETGGGGGDGGGGSGGMGMAAGGPSAGSGSESGGASSRGASSVSSAAGSSAADSSNGESSGMESGSEGGYVGGGAAIGDGDSSDSSAGAPTAKDLGAMKVAELRDALIGFGLGNTGLKKELLDRLKEHYGLEDEEEEEEDSLAEHLPLHAGPCAATFTHNGALGKDGGKKLKATQAGNMEREGIARMIAEAPSRGFAFGTLVGDDDGKLMTYLKKVLSPELFALLKKLSDPNHRIKNMSNVFFQMVTGFPGKVPRVDVISTSGAKLIKKGVAAAIHSNRGKVSDGVLKGKLLQVLQHLHGEHHEQDVMVGSGTVTAPGCDIEECPFLQATGPASGKKQKQKLEKVYWQKLGERRKRCFGTSNKGNMSKGVRDAILTDWAGRKKDYLGRVGDINHPTDSNVNEAGHRAFGRFNPKDGRDNSKTQSFTQRGGMCMAEANSVYGPHEKMLIHSDIICRMTGRLGFHARRAFLRRSKHDAQNAARARTKEARILRREKQYRDSNTVPPPPPPPPPQSRSRARAATPPPQSRSRAATPPPALQRSSRKRPALVSPPSVAVVVAAAACSARRASTRRRRGDPPPKYS